MGASSLDSSMMQASLGQSQGRQLELQNRVRGLNESSSSRLTPEQKEKRLREACEGFESIFIQKMWQQMRATLPQNGLLHSRDEKMWQDMYDQELAKSMSSVGGIGLADMMYEQLSRNLVSASRGTAGAGGRSAAFVAEAAPLVTPAAATPAEAGRSPAVVADASAEAPQAAGIYEGYAPVSGVVDQAAAPAAQPQAASTQLAALQPPAAPQPEKRQIEVRRHQRTPDQLSGLQMAQQAQRQAGDKLGNGVRPASRRRRQQEENAWQATQPASVAQAGTAASPAAAAYAQSAAQVGSPAAMQAAMQPPLTPAQIAQPVAPFAQPGMPTAQQANASDVVRVRYQTNIPQQAQQLRQGLNQDLIRTINLDAGGQKAGQGIRAYHAQGNSAAAQQTIQTPQAAQLEASRLQAQMQQQSMNAMQGQPQAGQAPVAPLSGAQATAQAQPQQGQQMPASGIPPLTAPHASMGQTPVLQPAQKTGKSRLSAEEALIAGVPM